MQAIPIIAALAFCYQPLGKYVAHTFTSPKNLKIEKIFYRQSGINPNIEQSWKKYTYSVIIFSTLGITLVFLASIFQNFLPLNNGMAAMPPLQAINNAISYTTTTNWQNYTPETTLSTGMQTLLLTVQNFLAAATGLAVAIALIRALTNQNKTTIGNFWVDLTRSITRILFPLALIFAITLIATGVIQDFWDKQLISELGTQTIPGKPVASQEAIKILGNNGGGYFNANSAHPFENPNLISNLLQTFFMLLLPTTLIAAFGKMVKDKKQGYTLIAVVAFLFITTNLLSYWSLNAANNFGEGTEQRFTTTGISLFTASTTLTGTGAINTAFSSLPPLTQGVAMFNMMLGEIAPGSIGSGLYTLLVLVIITVFICGLMVGRSPEYLGKKIGTKQIKLVSLFFLTTPVLVLVGTTIAVLVSSMQKSTTNIPINLTEILYTFVSIANNNGSTLPALDTSGTGYTIVLSLVMLFGRFIPIVLILALAGSFTTQTKVPNSTATVPTNNFTFGVLLTLITIIFTALIYFPIFALGPLAEGIN